MSFTTKGFNQNISDSHKADPAVDAEISSLLSSLVEVTEPYADAVQNPSTADLIDEPFPLNQRICLPPGQMMEKDELFALNNVYLQDQEDAEQMLAALNDRPQDAKDPVEERSSLNRCAIRALIRGDTDRSTETAGAVAGFMYMPPATIELLEQFFEICQSPNAAEIELLGRAGEVNTRAVSAWFKQKKDVVYPMYAARASIRRAGPAGHYLRNQRYEMERRAPRKKKPLTRH
ncbi:MAG: hypothetical protein M1827_007369 [Pycnora praestabilis]|nr:MAG: hypothetical protein M1827_007369 [Pycnora praestabilis]